MLLHTYYSSFVGSPLAVSGSSGPSGIAAVSSGVIPLDKAAFNASEGLILLFSVTCLNLSAISFTIASSSFICLIPLLFQYYYIFDIESLF